MAGTIANQTRTKFKIFKGSGDTKFVTIPQALAHALGLKAGDYIEWKIDRGDLILRKI